jgi:molecular chaperone GrpE
MINKKEQQETQKNKTESPEIKSTENFQEQFEAQKKQYAELKDSLQRLQAEFINYRKRIEDEKSKFVNLANEQLIKKMLPIMDNLELALQAKKEDTDFSKGIEMIYAQIREFLYDEGLNSIISKGKFDPKLHEAILSEESNKEQGTIIQELQKGYTLGDRVIRHAKVKISKQKTTQSVGGN